MNRPRMMIGLATPRVASSLDEGLETVRRMASDAASRGAEVVCFPEAYLPGLRGQDFAVLPFEARDQQRVMDSAADTARTCNIAVIIGTELVTGAGRQIAACVFDAGGRLLATQTKNQLDPTEDRFYVPGNTRQVFAINGVTCGIAICHEGFRYPETVRWAAVRGASVVFHPHCTGAASGGVRPAQWGASDSPYYEKAMMMRSIENAIYFASVNYALPYQESATSLIDPSGRCQAYLPYGEEGVLVQPIDLSAATGVLARRYAPDRYGEGTKDEA